MAFVGPLDAFNSEPIQTKVGTSQTNIFTATSTKVTKDTSGKVNGGETSLYYSATAGNYVPAATTTDGGKTWTYLKDSSGKEILGADAKKSLEQGVLKNNTQQQVISATKQRPLGGGLTPEEQKVVAPSTQNNATTPAVGDQQAAIPTGQTETVPSIETVELKGKQFRIAPDSGLTYPLNRKSTQDRIKFQAYKILPRTGQSQASSGINLDFRFGQRNYESVDGPVFLAIQAGISDQNSVDWGPDSVNAIESALYNASINLMQTDTGQELGNKVNDLAGQIQGELRRRGGTFGRYLAGQAAGINNVLARTDNIVLNPNLELLFQGPQLRPFSFQFKMSAREKPEAEQVKKIIKYFKYHMATRQETTGLFLKAPNVFKIEYQYGTSTPHPGLNLIKECALTNCSVDYTPLGTYATYEDGTMVAYTLSLQFQELEPVYDTNYTKDQPIGY